MASSRTYLPATRHALAALGAQIGAGRRERGWTAAELAGRLGVDRRIVTQIERGDPATGVGTVIEAAVLCGVPLFGSDATGLSRVEERERARLALLPERVRRRPVAIDNDF